MNLSNLIKCLNVAISLLTIKADQSQWEWSDVIHLRAVKVIEIDWVLLDTNG